MASYFSFTIVVLVAYVGSSMAGIVPAAVAAPAPLIAAAPAALAAAPIFGYTKAVPQNVPPHASRIDLSTKTLAAPYIAAPAAAPYIAAPAAAPYISAPAAAPYIAASATAPYIAAPAAAPYFAAPAVAPAHLAYSPYAYPGNLAAPFVQPAIVG